ncbi:MAG: hypothetical protein R6U66_05280 [Bacteroidales bacterium]
MKKLLLHSLIGIILLVLLNQLAIYSGSIYKDGASIICEAKREAVRTEEIGYQKGKTNVLFMGASGMLAGVNPEVFDSIFQDSIYSVNMALPALPIASNYHYLKDYLANNPAPQYIIMPLHLASTPFLLFDTYANQGLNFPNELVSYFFNVKGKNQVVNYLLPIHVYRASVFKYLKNRIVNPEDIERTRRRNKQIVEKMIAQKGYYFIQEQAKFPDGRLPEDYTAPTDCDTCIKQMPNPFSDPYVEKFFDLTEKKNIQVMLVNYPQRRGSSAQYTETPEQLIQLTKIYAHVSLPPEGWKIPFYDNRYFSDPHHLNIQGSNDYTRKIAHSFRKRYLN